jgi:hypothetical protein
MGRCHDIPDLSEACGSVCDDKTCNAPDSIASSPRVGGGNGCHDVSTAVLQMDDSEADLFDCWASEFVGIGGTAIDYFTLNLAKSTRDEVYDEPVDMVWDGPYRYSAHVRYTQERTAEAREEGMVWDIRMEIWIPRTAFEVSCTDRPKEGDVIRVWQVPFFGQWGSGNSVLTNAGYYFDVTNVQDDGHIFDGPHFVGFKLSAKRTTTYVGERRIFGDGPARVT